MAVSFGIENPQLLWELNVIYGIQGLDCGGRKKCGILGWDYIVVW